MGLLSRGQALVTRVMTGTEPVPVVYSRLVGGVTRSVALTGWLGRTLFAGLTEQDVSVQWGEGDLLFAASSLVLPTTGLTTPAQGDRVSFTVGGSAGVYEVSSPDTGEPCWRWSDHGRTRLRVHLKRVS